MLLRALAIRWFSSPVTMGVDRQANAALHRIVVARLRHDQPTKDYLARRLREGKTKKEAIRCLKRYVAREVFAALPR
jgi:transposase